jgi:hypothetical protein
MVQSKDWQTTAGGQSRPVHIFVHLWAKKGFYIFKGVDVTETICNRQSLRNLPSDPFFFFLVSMTFIKSLQNRIQNPGTDSWCKRTFKLYQFTWYNGVKVLWCLRPNLKKYFLLCVFLNILTLLVTGPFPSTLSGPMSWCQDHPFIHSKGSDQSSRSWWRQQGKERKWQPHSGGKKEKSNLLVFSLSE